MRKIVAICMMIILLFNIGGYRIAISLLQDNADTALESRLDKSDYDESQLVEIRVNMNLPYQQRYTDFERHYGEIEIDGHSYTYVKKKIEGDVVIFKCIANKTRQQLKSVQNDMAQANSSNDANQPGQQKNTSFSKNFWSEYDEQIEQRSLAVQISQTNNLISTDTDLLPKIFTNTPHQPPEALGVLS